ncbi:uncharacterized protein TRIADDRAFT_61433 [Trichoplax adhaerens]|uniref:Transforming acidic coiled-coil-containing protein C-terminal domain-containing protein n=1 Tax=Trichoplax adhaerens TaxID=10228 RepID=B3SAZ2_TRIAD|nr:hypothetical protein TRIADDRAFT_61433 [Trichoplax adhaerens]EDV20017.1 hypothetical protein TRIADDRAFT_61433 [Trichoplax adhaerens]|eukprot:XP_002117401.1 hypothetical protein TRIADDRAFT_61433 [Trichoplax adhaerens]
MSMLSIRCQLADCHRSIPLLRLQVYFKEEVEVGNISLSNCSQPVAIPAQSQIENQSQESLQNVNCLDLRPSSEEGDMSTGNVSSPKKSSVDDFSERIANLTSDIEKILGQSISSPTGTPSESKNSAIKARQRLRNRNKSPIKAYTPTTPEVNDYAATKHHVYDVNSILPIDAPANLSSDISDQSMDSTKTSNDFKGPAVAVTVSDQDADGDIDYSNVSFNPEKIAQAFDFSEATVNQQGNFVRVGTFRKKKTDNRPTIIPNIESPIASPTVAGNSLFVPNNDGANFALPIAPTTDNAEDNLVAAPMMDSGQGRNYSSATMIKKPKEPVNHTPASQQQIDEDEFVMAIEEGFKSSQAFTQELDYLEKIGTGATVQESALARQSLYVKFDPYVKPSMKNRNKFKPMPPSNENLLLLESPNSYMTNDETQPSPTEQDVSLPQDTAVQRSDVDKLLSFSPQAEQSNTTTTATVPTEPGEQEIFIDTQPSVAINQPVSIQLQETPKSKSQNTEKTVSDQKPQTGPTLMETEIVSQQLQKENQSLRKEINALRKGREMDRKENEELNFLSIKAILKCEIDGCYYIETTETQKAEHNREIEEICRERDQAQADINSVETAFSDLHKRYEKLKGFVEGYRKNEETLKACIVEYQQKLKKSEKRYQTLKNHAEEKIDSANKEIINVRKGQQAELAALQAALRREQAKNAGLESSLKQKAQENAELTSICDELIGKIGK